MIQEKIAFPRGPKPRCQGHKSPTNTRTQRVDTLIQALAQVLIVAHKQPKFCKLDSNHCLTSRHKTSMLNQTSPNSENKAFAQFHSTIKKWPGLNQKWIMAKFSTIQKNSNRTIHKVHGTKSTLKSWSRPPKYSRWSKHLKTLSTCKILRYGPTRRINTFHRKARNKCQPRVA